jgi:hypothetical protein
LRGETKAPSQSASEFSPSFFGGEASALSSLSLFSLSLLSLSSLSLSLLSAHRILPLFCSMGGEASDNEGRKPRCLSRHQGQGAARTRTQQSTVFFFGTFLFTFSGIIFSRSTVSTFTTSSSNMDTDPETTTPGTGNNTEDALVESSLINAQAAPDKDGVQIVPPPPPAARSNHKKRKKSNDGDDQQSKQKKQRKLPAIFKKRPAISDVDLEKQLNRVRNATLQDNVVDSSLQATQAPDLGSYDCSDEDVIEVTNYFTMDVISKRSSPWWEGFVQFIPIKHPTLYKEYVLCKECSTFHKKSNKGIVKVGMSQSTSNLRAHKKHHHPAEYETIAKRVDKTTIRSSVDGGLPKSIMMMPGFSVKLKVKDSRLLYRTAAATLTIEEGIPFRIFAQPSFRRLFTPLNSESDRIVSLNRPEVRDSVIEMGGFAIEATKREIRNHKIAWTTDHWTGADKGT